MTTKICKTCKEEYPAKRKSQVFCSANCQRVRGKNEPIQRLCKLSSCGRSFYVDRPSDPKKFCSRSCAATINNTLAPKRSLEGTCNVCCKPVSATRKYCDEHKYGHGTGVYVTADNSIAPSPKKCRGCSEEFVTSLQAKKFCTDECRMSSYRSDNGFRGSRSKCIECGDSISPGSVRCLGCHRLSKYRDKIVSWYSGEWSGDAGGYLSKAIRRHLLEKANYCCEGCGFNTPHPSDGQTILEIDHIDGDGSNHRPENLRVLCPNCHALTPTYRARNVGNGRKVYYLRVSRDEVDEVVGSVV